MAVCGTASGAAEPRRLRVDALVAVSPLAGFEEMGDAYIRGVGVELGVGAAVSKRLLPGLDASVGLHYDLGWRETGTTVHFVSVPFLAVLVVPVSRPGELHAGAGVGPAIAVTDGLADEGSVLYFGPCTEVYVGYARAIRRWTDLLVQLGARFDVLWPTNNGECCGATLAHGQMFLRAGIGWW